MYCFIYFLELIKVKNLKLIKIKCEYDILYSVYIFFKSNWKYILDWCWCEYVIGNLENENIIYVYVKRNIFIIWEKN